MVGRWRSPSPCVGQWGAAIFALPALVAVAACGSTAVSDLDEVAPVVELLRESASAAYAVNGNRLVAIDGDGVWLDDPVSDGTVQLVQRNLSLTGAAGLGSVVLIATQGELLAYEGIVGPSALAGSLAESVTGMVEGANGDVLFATDSGHWLYREGSLQPVPVALDDMTLASDGVLWGRTDRGLEGWALQGAQWVRTAQRKGEVTSIAPGPGGTLLAAIDGALHSFDGGWDATRLDEPVTRVMGAPHAPAAWVITESSLLSYADGELRRVDDAPAELSGDVDDAGRLILAGDEGLRRVSAGRSAAIAGVWWGQALIESVEVLVIPNEPSAVQAIALAVDGEPLQAIEPGRFLLDPTTFTGQGPFEVRATVDYSDEQVVASVQVGIAVPDYATWLDHIEPIYQARCSECHDGATQTVLVGPEVWQARVDDILDAVTSERMPLGKDPLAATDIALIRAWRDTGFELR